MFSYQYQEILLDINKVMEGSLHKTLENLNTINTSIFSSLRTTISSSKSQNESLNRLNQTKNLIVVSKQKIKPDFQSFYQDLEILKKSLANLNTTSIVDESDLNSINDFSRSFQDYFHDQSDSNAFDLITYGDRLFTILKITHKNLQILTNSYSQNLDPLGNRAVITIILSSDMDYKTFTAKLKTINEAYSKIAAIHDISEIDYPLEIVKAESGSLFLRAVGEQLIVSILSQMIVLGAEAAFSEDDEISKLSTKLELLEQQAETAKVIFNGAENIPEELTEEMKSNYVLVIKEINKIVEGEKEIIIDDKLLKYDDSEGRMIRYKDNRNSIKMLEKSI